MKKLILALAFHPGDYNQALDLLKWIRDFTKLDEPRVFLFVYPATMGDEPRNAIHEILGDRFALYFTNPNFEPKGWPQGPNAMFDSGARYVQECFNHEEFSGFLWLEPDAIPITPDWIQRLEAEYNGCDKPFMGNKVPNETIPTKAHMNGVGIYPCFLARFAPTCFNQVTVPWDIACSMQVVPQMHDTKLIQHCWRPETFKGKKLAEVLKPSAVLFHQCKDLSLTIRLRTRHRL